jgi:aromatic ring-opening dioxygenase catalytic subunit (LigB family)
LWFPVIETRRFALTATERPPLIYDYSGFPSHTYKIQYDVPGAPALAARAVALLRNEGLVILGSGMSFHTTAATAIRALPPQRGQRGARP